MTVLAVPGVIRNGQVEKFGEGDRITGTVAAGQSATGGLALDFAAGDRMVQTAGAVSVIFAGLAMWDAPAGGKVGIAMEGVWLVTSTLAAAAGNRMVTAAAGQFNAAGATPDARTLVGRAIQDIGAAGIGAVKIRT